MNVKRFLSSVSWRDVLARLPLPMLALAASYGVYRFASMFVPVWVAIVQAAAFELVYIGLAVVRLDEKQQRRARSISIGAVVVSMAYNSLDGLFHRRPDLLVNPPLWADVALSLLHGVPLAALAYLVADLLLHSAEGSAKTFGANASKGSEASRNYGANFGAGRPARFSPDDLLRAVSGEDEFFSRDLVVSRLGCSDSTADRLLDQLVLDGRVERSSKGVYRLVGGVL